MCKPLSEGGQRCAAHTRPRYQSATFGTPRWDADAIAHASTASGRHELEAERAQARRDGDTERYAALHRALFLGQEQRQVNQAVKEAVDRARAEERALRDADAERGRALREAEESEARTQRLADNETLGRGEREYDAEGVLVFDPEIHDGHTHPHGNHEAPTGDPLAFMDDFDFGSPHSR